MPVCPDRLCSAHVDASSFDAPAGLARDCELQFTDARAPHLNSYLSLRLLFSADASFCSKDWEVILPASSLLGRARYRFSFHLLMLSVSGFWHLPDIGNLRMSASPQGDVHGGESPIRLVHGSASVSRPERVRGSAQVAIRSNTAGWDITADIASGSVHENDSMSPTPRCYWAVWLRRFVTSCAVSRDPLLPKRAVT
jgi:hypothetical protein